jgi:ABC-type lipoprotein export system ATPase subunit
VLTALIGETGAGKTTLMVRTHALPVQADPSSSVSRTLADGANVQW